MVKLIATLLICLSSVEASLVNVSELTTELMNEIARGEHPDLTVEFSANSRIPFRFFLKGDLFDLQEEGTLQIKQTIYVRCQGDKIVVSFDQINWGPFMEFITGTASALLSIDEGRPSIAIGAEANLRLN